MNIYTYNVEGFKNPVKIQSQRFEQSLSKLGKFIGKHQNIKWIIQQKKTYKIELVDITVGVE